MEYVLACSLQLAQTCRVLNMHRLNRIRKKVAFLSGKKNKSNIIQETAEMSRSGSKMSFVWQIEITFRPCGNRFLFPLLLLCFAFRTCFWQLKMSFYASCNTLVAGSKIGLR